MASGPDADSSPSPRIFRPRWSATLLVCGKCLKRHDDGKALRRALKDELKAIGKDRPKSRRPRLVKTACMGLCPKRSVVLASGETLAKGEVMLVREAGEISALLREKTVLRQTAMVD